MLKVPRNSRNQPMIAARTRNVWSGQANATIPAAMHRTPASACSHCQLSRTAARTNSTVPAAMNAIPAKIAIAQIVL
jgi:hypothetical protein